MALICQLTAAVRPTKPPKSAAVSSKKPAVTELEGNKWNIVRILLSRSWLVHLLTYMIISGKS
jgi:hypothetical protein